MIKVPQNKFLLFLLLVFGGYAVFEAFSFCTGKTITCPPYDDTATLNWFSYSPGQKLFFTNGISADTLTVSNFHKSETSQLTQSMGCNKSTVACQSSYHFSLIENNGTAGEPAFYLFAQKTEGGQPFENSNVMLNTYNLPAGSGYMSDTGIVRKPGDLSVKSLYYQSIVLNGVTYSRVQMLQPGAPNVVFKIDLIYISKNNGIIAYRRTGNPSLFVKQ